MAALLFACSFQLIGLYSAGRFTPDDIAPIAMLLKGWAINLPIYAAYMYVYRVFSALKDMKTVAVCNGILTVAQVLLYMLFTGVIAIPGFGGFGLVGIALGDICFYSLMLLTLLTILRSRLDNLKVASVFTAGAKVLVASVVGAVVACLIARGLDQVLDTGYMLWSFVALLITGVVGLCVIVAMCRLLHVDELSRMIGALRAKLLRR